MKHRTHKDFPSYRFYSDGRIKNKTTNHFIKVKKHMKLIDAKGVLRYKNTLPNYFLTYIHGKMVGANLSLPMYLLNVGNV